MTYHPTDPTPLRGFNESMQKFYDRAKHKGEVWPGTIDEDFKIGVLLGCQAGRKHIKSKMWLHRLATAVFLVVGLDSFITFIYFTCWGLGGMELRGAVYLILLMVILTCLCAVHTYRNILMLKNLRGFIQVSYMWEEKLAELVDELRTEAT